MAGACDSVGESMLRIDISTTLPLDEPDTDSGLIAWISVRIYDCDDEDLDEKEVGSAFAAIVYVGQAANVGAAIHEVLDADSGELEALGDVYFDDEWIKDEFTDGIGNDLLYIADISLAPEYEHRNIEYAVVRRLCDTVGQSCGIAVLEYVSEAEINHWERIGFEVSTPGESAGHLHLKIAALRARVADVDGSGRFRVLANVSPELRKMQN